MNFHSLLRERVEGEALPPFIRRIEERPEVRVVWLQGDVGRDVGTEFERVEGEGDAQPERFEKHLLLDFGDVTSSDFATMAYLIETLRHRLPTQKRVGLSRVTDELSAELDLAKVRDLFSVFGSVEEGVRGLEGDQSGADPSA